jgi:hypothetical protein
MLEYIKAVRKLLQAAETPVRGISRNVGPGCDLAWPATSDVDEAPALRLAERQTVEVSVYSIKSVLIE